MDVNSGSACHQGAAELSGKANFSQISRGQRKIADGILAPSQSERGDGYTFILQRGSYRLMMFVQPEETAHQNQILGGGVAI